jgi:hypothetical protein
MSLFSPGLECVTHARLCFVELLLCFACFFPVLKHFEDASSGAGAVA